MQKVPFVKYTSNGNSFVIVDEVVESFLNEKEKSSFAFHATNEYFGIGSDNLLVIQSAKKKTLLEINAYRHYWAELPDPNGADFIFRMFEPSGEEAFCCGNGLLCIANYLYHRYGIDATTILTEIPLSQPKAIVIGTYGGGQGNWANMGFPRRLPAVTVDRSTIARYDDEIDLVGDLNIDFRSDDLKPFTTQRDLSISGFLVFTGEPHLVIFPRTGFSITELENAIFPALSEQGTGTLKGEKRHNFGSWLVQHVGSYLNTHYRDLFPLGLNVNFVRSMPRANQIEYRCFERGIDRETMACGTGALAASYVARRLGFLDQTPITVLPHQGNHQHARFHINATQHGWHIATRPWFIFQGTYSHASPARDRDPYPAPDYSWAGNEQKQDTEGRRLPGATISQPVPKTHHDTLSGGLIMPLAVPLKVRVSSGDVTFQTESDEKRNVFLSHGKSKKESRQQRTTEK